MHLLSYVESIASFQYTLDFLERGLIRLLAINLSDYLVVVGSIIPRSLHRPCDPKSRCSSCLVLVLVDPSACLRVGVQSGSEKTFR